MSEQAITVETFTIHKGAVYRYAPDLPRGRKGHHYRVVDFVIDVPVNNHKVLVRCLSGPDAGLLFTNTPVNFSRRYQLAEEPPSPTKVAPAEVLLALGGSQ